MDKFALKILLLIKLNHSNPKAEWKNYTFPESLRNISKMYIYLVFYCYPVEKKEYLFLLPVLENTKY